MGKHRAWIEVLVVTAALFAAYTLLGYVFYQMYMAAAEIMQMGAYRW